MLKPPWTEVFAEICLRALLRVHHDYLLCLLQQTWTKEMYFSALNRGPGVALADELTVCAAISQEFLASRLPAGSWVEGSESLGIEAGQRYYRLSREVTSGLKGARVDFRVERVESDNEEAKYPPVFIEAKRAFLWTTKLNGTVDRVTKQTSSIRRDIEKLSETHFDKKEESQLSYLLVWNVTDRSSRTDIGPFEYVSELSEKSEDLTIRQLRVAPLSVTPLTDEAKLEDLKVDRWLWVVLIEVTHQKPSLTGKDAG